MSRVLLITNDFPPRQGGIQSFVYGMASRLPVDELVVYCSTSPGADEFDAAHEFKVVRENTSILLPTRHAARTAAGLAREHSCDTVLFGAAAPLGLLAAGLKQRGDVAHAAALTHGHETGWAMLPGGRTALRRIARYTDVVTYLGEYTRDKLAPAIGDLTRLERLTFGVDTDRFSPEVDGKPIRKRYGLGDRPVVGCVSRLVPRKGQDMLIRTLPRLRQAVPEATLLLVGGGPYESSLRRLAQRCGVAEHVVITGAADSEELPAHFAAADVFAMPCRTRRRGLDVEGLGVVYLEAAATGLPVVVGDSGGAPDTVRDGETGYVVDGRDVDDITARLVELLQDPAKREAFGDAGREWMYKEWSWPVQTRRLASFLDA
ncbi:MAG: glycosyltransferase family 4 protein [Stackebrandtia sp.]